MTILYPVLIFLLLVVYKFPVRVISLCVIALALIFFISSTGNSSKENFSDARENSPKNSADENGKNS
ncbi:MAG: hypothetical protein K2N58_04655, partial [Treponemataceae bacterium]|nr:hypothetical protein [Treponemataceae bacterium]